MADQQAVEPLTDEELQAVAQAHPEMVAKFTSDERRRLSKFSGVPRMGPTNENDPVTLGDVLDNPSLAASRAGHLLMNDIRDPRTWAGLAASFVVPETVRAMMPTRTATAVPAPAAPVKPTGTAPLITPSDLAEMVPGMLRVPAKIAARMYQRGQSAPPAPEAAPAPTPAPTPAPPETPASAPMASKGRPAAGSRPLSAAAAASADLTPAEAQEAMKWAGQGVPVEVIAKRIVISRQLNGTLKTPAPDAVKAIIEQRNATGRWPE